MDPNQQNQQPQVQNQAPNQAQMGMPMQNPNMMGMRPNQVPQQNMQMFAQNPGFGGMPPQMQNQAQNMAMMQQMAAGQPQMFNQPRPGQGGMPGAPPPPGQGNQNSQYRAKQPGQMGQHPAMGGGMGMPGGQQMGRDMPNMMQGMGMNPGFPAGIIDQMKLPGMFNNNSSGPSNSGAPKKKYDPSTALYIGNLSNTTYELDLYKFFTSSGYKLKNARIMFDDQSRSKGFGYLNFHDAQEAQRCLDEMNNKVIGGKAIVLNKQKDRDFDSNANLIVRNLPKSFDQRQMSDLFGKFGKIGSCKLEIYPSGESRGFGYVQFDSTDAAQKAIKELDGKNIDGQQISVLVHSKRENREGMQSDRFTNLFLQNLPHDFTQDQLRDLFKSYGEIISVDLASKPGHGYVNFKSHEDAKKAMDAVNMKVKLSGETILVQPHIYKKESDLKPTASHSNPIVQNQKELFRSNIFVRFIPNEITREELETEFSKAGTICSIKMRGHNAKSQIDGSSFQAYQVAYVLFNDVKAAQKAIRLFDSEKPFGYNNKPLKVDFWQAQDDLKQEREEKSQNAIKAIINLIRSGQSKQNNYMGYQGGAPMQQQPMGAPQGMMPHHQQQNFGGYQGGHNQGHEGHDGHKQGYQGDRRRDDGKRGNMNPRGRGGHGQRGGQRGGHQHQGQRGGHKPQGQRPNPQGQNQMMQQNMGQGMQINQGAQLKLPNIDPAPLDNLTGEDRENFVGNNIYGSILEAYGESEAPTITGMILDEGAVDYKQLLTDQKYFESKVKEARAIFKKSQAEQTAQQQQ